MVDRSGARPTRRNTSVRISASVISDLVSTNSRRSASCGSRIGRRYPPIRAGRTLPVARTRRISLIAAEVLTEYRPAALRIELPSNSRHNPLAQVLRQRCGHPDPHVTQPSARESDPSNPCNLKLL